MKMEKVTKEGKNSCMVNVVGMIDWKRYGRNGMGWDGMDVSLFFMRDL